MAIQIATTLNFANTSRIVNLPDGVSPQDAATVAQLQSAVEGLAWKDSARVAAQANTNLAAPGATVDGITLVANDRVLIRAQTVGAENGIYIFNGASVAMTRALDANTAPELEQAVVTVEEGTSNGVSYRQTAVNFALGTTSVVWAAFGTSAGPASASSAGIVQLATQVEVDSGVDALKVLTPATLAGSVFGTRKVNQNIGDGSATSYTVTHNLNTRDVKVDVYRNSGNFDGVLAEVQRTTVNSITILFDVAPAANAFRVLVRA